MREYGMVQHGSTEKYHLNSDWGFDKTNTPSAGRLYAHAFLTICGRFWIQVYHAAHTTRLLKSFDQYNFFIHLESI